jgi:integrase
MQGTIHRTHADTLARDLKNHVMPVFAENRFYEITPHRIERFLIDLFDSGYKANTIKRIYQALRGVLNEAERLRIIGENPCSKVRKPKITKRSRKGVFTMEEAQKLLDEFSIEQIWGPGNTGFMHYVINLIAAGTGLRTCEIQAIRIGKVDFDRRLVKIDETWERVYGSKNHTKTDSSNRFVTLSSKMVRYLKKLINGRKDPKGL